MNESRPDLSSPSRVRALLGELGVVPSKAMGQSFLVDRNVLGMLVRTVDPRVDDAVLEVGPGLGVVTEQLLATCGKVVAV